MPVHLCSMCPSMAWCQRTINVTATCHTCVIDSGFASIGKLSCACFCEGLICYLEPLVVANSVVNILILSVACSLAGSLPTVIRLCVPLAFRSNYPCIQIMWLCGVFKEVVLMVWETNSPAECCRPKSPRNDAWSLSL